MPDELYQRRKHAPIYWFNKSSDLMGAAGALWISMKSDISETLVSELKLSDGYSMGAAVGPVYRMLCGMSLELLYKAILVAQRKEPDHSHDLIKLANDAGLSIDSKERGLLQILSASIVWYGRYPVPKKENHLSQLHCVQDEFLNDKVPFGKLTVLKPNGALDWEPFHAIWRKGCRSYENYHWDI